jgi:hypothetical protein
VLTRRDIHNLPLRSAAASPAGRICRRHSRVMHASVLDIPLSGGELIDMAQD